MSAIALKAHYDSKQVCLNEPYAFEPNAKLIVMVVSADSQLDDRLAWLASSQAGLARAYGDDEPDYSAALLLETPAGQ